MTTVRTRFSPSPTGYLHLGGAHTALFNWLFARHHGGVFILRIEDTDRERSEARFEEDILEALTWLGLTWDEGPYRQTERLPLYREFVERLLAQGAAYYCDCQPRDPESLRQTALALGVSPKYDGRCRERGLGPGPGRAVRFKTPKTGTTHWQDLIKGPIAFDNQELDDLVILRRDGIPTYNLAVVVDDITMRVTHVIRGDDHISNTPRQLLIYQALKVAPPFFAHMPLMLSKDRTKLSKRRGALPVSEYRRLGYLPHTLINYLARLGWSHGDQEIFTREELIRYFSLEQVGKAPGVHDEEKLLWLNSHYLKTSRDEDLARELAPFLKDLGITPPDLQYLAKVVATLKTRAKTLVEMAEAGRFYFQDPRPYEPEGAQKFLTPESAPLLKKAILALEALPDLTEASLTQMLRDLAAQAGVKVVAVAQPLRVALTGRTASPSLTDVISLLGKRETIRRLEEALKEIHKGDGLNPSSHLAD
jgi:glutamyl-tRNA synthetase|uniref:Glutamate--tRNA ligase n=1 Tax=Desulfobacca acetoxidans TaxID=60893 RepID=A0A7C5ALX0_9BACT